MCEYFAHPVHMLRKVPQDMPWERVPLAEPLVISMSSFDAYLLIQLILIFYKLISNEKQQLQFVSFQSFQH